MVYGVRTCATLHHPEAAGWTPPARRFSSAPSLLAGRRRRRQPPPTPTDVNAGGCQYRRLSHAATNQAEDCWVGFSTTCPFWTLMCVNGSVVRGILPLVLPTYVLNGKPPTCRARDRHPPGAYRTWFTMLQARAYGHVSVPFDPYCCCWIPGDIVAPASTRASDWKSHIKGCHRLPEFIGAPQSLGRHGCGSMLLVDGAAHCRTLIMSVR